MASNINLSFQKRSLFHCHRFPSYWHTDARPNSNWENHQLKTQPLTLMRQEYKDKYPHFGFAEAPDDEEMARKQAETGDWPG
jgi:hypothetical protein